MIIVEDVVNYENELYFAASDLNRLYKLDKSGEIVEIYEEKRERVISKRLYAKVFNYKDEIIFAPHKSDSILIYHPHEKKWDSIRIVSNNENENGLFQSGTIFEDWLYLLGCQYPAIVKVNLCNYNIEKIWTPFEEVINKYNGDCYFRSDIAVNDNKLFAASCVSNRVLEFNMLTNEYRWYKVGAGENKYSGIAFDGSNFWLAPRRTGPGVCWNPTTNVEIEFSIPIEYEDEEDKKRCRFTGAVFDGTNIVFPGMHIEKTLVINPKTKFPLDSFRVVNEKYIFFKNIDNKNYCLRDDGKLFQYLTRENIYDKHEIKVSNVSKILMDICLKNHLKIMEDKNIKLINFIGELSDEKKV